MNEEKPFEKQTLFWIVLSSLINEPLFIMYGFSTMILRKDFGVDEFTIACFVSMKPMVSILSYYWGAHLQERPDLVKRNFLLASILGRVLFLGLPFFPYPSFLILASTLYILFYRAAKPAWIEMLRINTTKEKKQTAFSWGVALGYLEGMVLAVLLGGLLDRGPFYWSYLFAFCALVSLLGIYAISYLPVACADHKKGTIFVKHPWKKLQYLLQTRKDFAKFQWGFMLCGFGLMFIQPAITLVVVDVLDLSYVRFGLAYTSWKGICIALSSPIWSKLLQRFSIFSLSSWIFLFASLLPLCLFFSPFHILWLYVGYIFYGIAQGGSQLVWNISGPVFSKGENSAQFTATNVLMIGVRGLIAPFLGAVFVKGFGPFAALFVGALICLLGAVYIAPSRLEAPA